MKAEGQKVTITGKEECGDLPQDLGYKNLISRTQREGMRTEDNGDGRAVAYASFKNLIINLLLFCFSFLTNGDADKSVCLHRPLVPGPPWRCAAAESPSATLESRSEELKLLENLHKEIKSRKLGELFSSVIENKHSKLHPKF